MLPGSPEAYQNNPRVGLIAGSGGGSRVSGVRR